MQICSSVCLSLSLSPRKSLNIKYCFLASPNLKEGPRLRQQLVPLVGRAPSVRDLGGAALPRLQVQGGPDHVEEGEQHEPHVLQELGATAQEELRRRRKSPNQLILSSTCRGFLATLIASWL